MSLDSTPEPLLILFIDGISIDRSFPRLLLFLRFLLEFHLHRCHRHYHGLINPFHPLSPLLLSHFCYLSLYNPFVTAFPSTTSAINDLIIPPTAKCPNTLYDTKFADFLATQEADPCCGKFKLKLQDWLLTIMIVQWCPRYWRIYKLHQQRRLGIKGLPLEDSETTTPRTSTFRCSTGPSDPSQI